MKKDDVLYEIFQGDDKLRTLDDIDTYCGEMYPPDAPESILLIPYTRVKLPEPFANPLEQVIESLEDEYGDMEWGTSNFVPSETLKAMERAMLNQIREEYVPWLCEKSDLPRVELRLIERLEDRVRYAYHEEVVGESRRRWKEIHRDT